MFNLVMLGKYGRELERFADTQGYVPEAGDHWSKMHYDGAIDWDADSWQDHVSAAVRATERAEQVLTDWRRQN